MSYTDEQIKARIAHRRLQSSGEARDTLLIIEQLLRERDEAEKRFEQTLAAVKAGNDLARDNSTKRNKQLTEENDKLSEIIIRLDARVTEAKSTALKAVRERIAKDTPSPYTNDDKAPYMMDIAYTRARNDMLAIIDEEMNRA